MVMEVNDNNFEVEVLNRSYSKPVLVDFWAPWCGPCLAMAPILEELCLEMVGTVKVVKINVDDNKQTAESYSIRSIPTLILFKDGKPAVVEVGLKTKEYLVDILK